jgi:copper chaperone CopZ
MKIIVKGMTCNHCEANVENGIRSLEGIDSAKADQVSERVVLSGEHIDLDQIREKVEGLGYKFGGLAE